MSLDDLHDPYLREKTPYKWRHVQLSKKFFQALMNEWYASPDAMDISNAFAYEVYQKHCRRDKEDPDPVWMQMNVRNQLSAAAYRGCLLRIRPGVYWPTDAIMSEREPNKAVMFGEATDHTMGAWWRGDVPDDLIPWKHSDWLRLYGGNHE